MSYLKYHPAPDAEDEEVQAEEPQAVVHYLPEKQPRRESSRLERFVGRTLLGMGAGIMISIPLAMATKASYNSIEKDNDYNIVERAITTVHDYSLTSTISLIGTLGLVNGLLSLRRN